MMIKERAISNLSVFIMLSCQSIFTFYFLYASYFDN